MRTGAAWTVVNRTAEPLVASADVETAAFHNARALRIRLDGSLVQTVMIEEGRTTTRFGPFPLTAGDHALVFDPIDPPTTANDVVHNGDRRALSIAVGGWRWDVERR